MLESNAVGTFENGIKFTHECGKDVSPITKKELEKLVLDWAVKQDVEKLLEKIAVEDSDWRVRAEVVRKITKEKLLEKIAVEDSDGDVRWEAKHQLKTLVK